MITKYNLEKEIKQGRSILDKVDKVHFRQAVNLTIEEELDESFANSGFITYCKVDLSLSNYFILDLRNYQEGDPHAELNIEFINPENVQRFEILIIEGYGAVNLNWYRDAQEVIFPFGEIDDEEGGKYYGARQRVITFRLGLSVIGIQQYIAISSDWFSATVYLDGDVSIINNSASYHNSQFLLYTLWKNESYTEPSGPEDDQEFYYSQSPIFTNRIDDDENVKFNMFRGYRFFYWIRSNPVIAPSYIGYINNGEILNDHETISLSLPQTFPYRLVKYYLLSTTIRYIRPKYGPLRVNIELYKDAGAITRVFDLSVNNSSSGNGFISIDQAKLNTDVKTPFNNYTGGQPWEVITMPYIYLFHHSYSYGEEPDGSEDEMSLKITCMLVEDADESGFDPANIPTFMSKFYITEPGVSPSNLTYNQNGETIVEFGDFPSINFIDSAALEQIYNLSYFNLG